jgi:hypothetical protein
VQFPAAGQFAPAAAAREKSVPVPVNETLCGLPDVLSVIVMLAARFPEAVGVKVTLIVHFAPTARFELFTGQVSVCAKSPLLVPLRAILEIVTAAVPVFVRVTPCGALVVVISWFPNERLADESVTAG